MLRNSMLILCLLLPFLATAEYNGHQIEFKITLSNSKEITGYNYLATVPQKDKSIDYKTYLEQNFELVLRNQFHDGFGESSYYQYRIKYDYSSYDGQKMFIYTLMDKKEIDKHKIKSFEITDMTSQSYTIGISSSHHYEDRHWMAKPAKEQFSFGGIFCAHDIYLHEKNAKNKAIIKELEKVDADYLQKTKELEEELNYSDGVYHQEVREKLEELEQGIDDKIDKVIGKLQGKVVIISMCTC